MSKRRKKKHNEDHMDESWLLPYSDLLTLLVALFIVLFASSAVDSQKFQALSSAFNAELKGGTGFFEFPSPVPEGGVNAPDKQQEEDNEQKKDQEKRQTSEQKAEHDQLEEIQHRVNTYVQENGLGNQLATSLTIEGLSVTIRDNVLFNSGSADVRTEDLEIAKEISRLLEMDVPRSIIVSGHTDNVPIKNANFESNWELSVMRAINFMKILLENDQLDPELFSAKGHGEFQPIASNESEAGRAQNRRVEILILPITDIE
jgi:chemotaxis protein MotB